MMAGQREQDRPASFVQRLRLWPCAAAVLLAAAAPDGIQITGRVLYGRAAGAKTAAVVDIVSVYARNPTYMHMKALGYSETDPQGQRLFAKAQSETKTALAKVARTAKVDVITVPGGVTGATAPVPDLSANVIALLPRYYVHGKVLHGRAHSAGSLAELSSQVVLAAIPEWRESQGLNENDAQYYMLRKRYMDTFARAVKQVARESGFDAVVEKGGVSSRVGPVPDITSAVRVAVQR